MPKIKIEEVISTLEADVSEAEHVISSDMLESVIEYLKDYEQTKIFIARLLVDIR